MIACEKCGRSSWRTIETRQKPEGVRRRKVCKCGNRITTVEKPAKSKAAPKERAET